MESPEPYVTPLRELVPVLMWAAVGVVAVFLVLMLARWWSHRAQQRGGECGGIDLEGLRRQRDRGEVSPEEYRAVRNAIVGPVSDPAPPEPRTARADADAHASIDTDEADTDNAGESPERTPPDDQT